MTLIIIHFFDFSSPLSWLLRLFVLFIRILRTFLCNYYLVLSLCELSSMKMKGSLPIKERIAKKRYQNWRDQFISVQNKNVKKLCGGRAVSTNLDNVFKSSVFFSEVTPWLFKVSASFCRKWREDGIIDSIAMCLAVISVAGNKIANNIDMPIFWKVTNKFCLDSFESVYVFGIMNICPSLSTASVDKWCHWWVGSCSYCNF